MTAHLDLMKASLKDVVNCLDNGSITSKELVSLYTGMFVNMR